MARSDRRVTPAPKIVEHPVQNEAAPRLKKMLLSKKRPVDHQYVESKSRGQNALSKGRCIVEPGSVPARAARGVRDDFHRFI